VVREDAWNDFYFFEFTKARFMAQDVIYPGEGSMCTWEKSEINNLTLHLKQLEKEEMKNPRVSRRNEILKIGQK